MKRLSVVLLALALAGCAEIDQNVSCPTGSTGVAFALQGSTVGNQLISMFGSASSMGLLAPRAAAVGPTTGATMKYRYLAVFGADSGSLTCVNPPAPPTVITTGPPPSILH